MRIQPPPIGRLETRGLELVLRVPERVREQQVRAQVQKQRVLPVQELALKLARELEQKLEQELKRKPEQAQQQARKPWRSRKPAFEPALELKLEPALELKPEPPFELELKLEPVFAPG